MRTLHPYLPMMPFNNCATNIQAQAQTNAGTASYTDAWHTIETLPDLLMFRREQARPLIAYGNMCETIGLRERHLNRHGRGGILEGIGQIIRDNLADAVRIGQNRYLMRWQGE